MDACVVDIRPNAAEADAVTQQLNELLNKIQKQCDDDEDDSDDEDDEDKENGAVAPADNNTDDLFVLNNRRMLSKQKTERTVKQRMTRVSQVLKPIEYTGFPALVQGSVKFFRDLVV